MRPDLRTRPALGKAGAKAFAQAHRRLKRTYLGGDEEGAIEVATRLVEESEALDKGFYGTERGDSNAMDYLSVLAAWVAQHPTFLDILFELSKARDANLRSAGQELLARLMQLLPDLAEAFFLKHEVLLQSCAAVKKAQQACTAIPSEETSFQFITSATLLGVVLKNYTGIEHDDVQAQVKRCKQRYNLCEMWRALCRQQSLVKQSPTRLMMLNTLLLEYVAMGDAELRSVTHEDFVLVTRLLKVPEAVLLNPQASVKESVNARLCISDSMLAVALVVRKRADIEDFAFLQGIIEQKWLVKFAKLVRETKWAAIERQPQGMVCLTYLFAAAAAFAARWPLNCSHAGLTVLAAEKLRYILGFTKEWLVTEAAQKLATKEGLSKAKFEIRVWEGNEEGIMSIVHFLGEWAKGEVLDMKYTAGAYNADRVAAVKHSKLFFLLNECLLLYPKNETIAEAVFMISNVLLNHPEQIYEARDAGLLDTLSIVRGKVKNPETQKNMLMLQKTIRDMTT